MPATEAPAKSVVHLLWVEPAKQNDPASSGELQ